MALDRRVPAVYVDIEDRSMGEQTAVVARTGYIVILSDRGPHNQIVRVDTPREFYNLFGKPDFMRYGQGHYLAEKFLQYSSGLYVCRPALTDTQFSANTQASDCMAMSNIYIQQNIPPDGVTAVTGDFEFTIGSNIVMAGDTTSMSQLTVGQWIYHETAEYQSARQIIRLDFDKLEITLDDKYSGSSASGDICTYTPFEVQFLDNTRTEADFDNQNPSILWYFIGYGIGKFYDNLVIKGVRNITFEKMFTDSSGIALYPYMFMDLSIYRNNEDGTQTLMEGPWTVSLVNRTPSGQIIRDINTGRELYITTVVNSQSKLVKVVDSVGAPTLMSVASDIIYPYAPDVTRRLIIQSLFSDGNVLGLYAAGTGGIKLQGGSNGNLFNDNGTLNFIGNSDYELLVAQAYNGTLKSVDGTVELILQEVYPWYVFDYVIAGGYNSNIANAARTLADVRNDCFVLADTGNNRSPEEDIETRRNVLDWNTWNAALYTQYREIDDPNTGHKFYVTPVLHALERHLWVDSNYWISEPVAGIEKGAISEPIKLAYKPNLTKLGDLIDAELNPVISEPDGVYIITQLTTYKTYSVMKRQHVVKFVQFIKKTIPGLLKDILQRKATNYWISQAQMRVNGFMNQYVEGNGAEALASITSYSAVVAFDDVRSEINIMLTIKPIRAIERINVNIIVT